MRVSGQFYFFNEKASHAQKVQKAQKAHKMHKNANKWIGDFFPFRCVFQTHLKLFFFVFVCLTLEFTIYFCRTSKLGYSLGPNKLVKVLTYIRSFTNLLRPKTFYSHFFRLKNKTALIASFILLLGWVTRTKKLIDCSLKIKSTAHPKFLVLLWLWN